MSKTAIAIATGMFFQLSYAADVTAQNLSPGQGVTPIGVNGADAQSSGVQAVTPAKASQVDAKAVPACVGYNQFNSRIEVAAIAMPSCLRVAPELGGLRGALADKGIGIGFISSLGYAYDLNGNNAARQTYNGQNPSYNQTTSLYLTYDLTRVGFSKNAQFTFSAQWATSSYRSANPHVATMSIFAIDQPLLDKQVELIYGFIPGVRLFYGMTLGGNASTSALGPQSVVPFQVGMSASEPTPTFDVIVRDRSLRFYDSFAVTRSSSPEGILKDIELNPSGFRLSVPGARALFINEMGYKRSASATANSAWFRLGTLYNTSPYTLYNASGKSSNNYEVYLNRPGFCGGSNS
ncbi:hypothetical protein [Paraburkholderia sp.]|uniref:hypothetical protein n=1 Tax=Paraburkholderia sp. TaxID=1926495 RepID=UPI00239358A3|nr:hypothetical protein [Paraburkholderia sp.]MDE1179322.1 hypothetical protein [Paraburkholderia sp.]